MYFAAVQQFAKTLSNLDKILEKATQSAVARKFNPDNFVNLRLYPDMLPFNVQIMIATDGAKTMAATLSEKEAPKYEDNEVTIADLQARIRKTIGYLSDFTAKDFAKVDESKVYPIPYSPGKGMHPQEAVLCRAIPNFYFHVSMAYAILRQGGVDMGKKDYLGDLNLYDLA